VSTPRTSPTALLAGQFGLRRAAEVLDDADRSLPVHPALHRLFSRGIAPGTSVGCTGTAAVSMSCLLAAGPSAEGRWVGVLGVGGLARLGAQACHEAGVDLERLLLVRAPQRGRTMAGTALGASGLAAGEVDDAWCAAVLGALVDGVDVVLVPASAPMRLSTARRVQARAQRRGVLFVVVGDRGGTRADGQVFSSDLHLTAVGRWSGLVDGAGHLRAREVEVAVTGRRMPHQRRDRLGFPDADGQIRSIGGAATVDGETPGTATIERATIGRAG
jgi:hypothetical protein